MVKGGAWFVAESEQLYTVPFDTISLLAPDWSVGIVMLALVSLVVSTGKEKLPLLAVVVVLFVPSWDVRRTCTFPRKLVEVKLTTGCPGNAGVLMQLEVHAARGKLCAVSCKGGSSYTAS